MHSKCKYIKKKFFKQFPPPHQKKKKRRNNECLSHPTLTLTHAGAHGVRVAPLDPRRASRADSGAEDGDGGAARGAAVTVAASRRRPSSPPSLPPTPSSQPLALIELSRPGVALEACVVCRCRSNRLGSRRTARRRAAGPSCCRSRAVTAWTF